MSPGSTSAKTRSPEAYVAPRELRDLRDLLRQRVVLTQMRTALKNRVHAHTLPGAFSELGPYDVARVYWKTTFDDTLDAHAPELLAVLVTAGLLTAGSAP